MKYLGFPLPKLETIYPIWAKGCRKIRDAEFLEDIRYCPFSAFTVTVIKLCNIKDSGCSICGTLGV